MRRGRVKPKKRMRFINKATLDHVLSFRHAKSNRVALIFHDIHEKLLVYQTTHESRGDILTKPRLNQKIDS